MIKIVTVVGARPQFIKAAAVSRAIRNSDNINEMIVHTGQHFDKNMSAVFFEEMDIPLPDYQLEINSLSHGAMTGRMLEKIEIVLQKEQPDLVLVYGDTNSTLAGALAAKKMQIKVAHVEAGLRSYNMEMPEEINRILTDRVSDLLFCPTQNAVKNLEQEGFSNFPCRILEIGDVMYDASLYYNALSSKHSAILDQLRLKKNQYALCTIHRQENTDELKNLVSIVAALNQVNEEMPVVLPLHPRTKKILNKNRIALNFAPIEPVGYFDIMELQKNSAIILTDSGGMQKEAYFHKKYCLTLRNETEWIELVENGFNLLTGPDQEKILAGVRQWSGKSITKDLSLFGKGDASEKIVDYINTASL